MAARSLKQLSKRPIRTKDYMAHLTSIREMPDEAMALASAAMVERALERSILFRLIRLSRKERNELFDGFGPLSGFAAKIRMAYALGIIGPDGQRDIESIKDIRNSFAHSFHRISFGTPAIARECRKLKMPERTTPLAFEGLGPWPPRAPRLRFTITCWALWIGLGGASVNKKRRPRRPRDSMWRMLLG